MELQVDEQLPIHVVPIRTPERVIAATTQQRTGSRGRRTVPLLDRLPSSGRSLDGSPP
jgi:hypothetical protein